MCTKTTSRSSHRRLAVAAVAAALVLIPVPATLAWSGDVPAGEPTALTVEEHAQLADGYRRQATEMAARAERAERVLATLRSAGGKLQQNMAGMQSDRVKRYRAQQQELVQLAESHEQHIELARR
ncbi:hypothetical protein L6Q96_21510 [Candidatus Binatia bacterium]|nr:hypothetical protein [Candidatus Binatia bacterium]